MLPGEERYSVIVTDSHLKSYWCVMKALKEAGMTIRLVFSGIGYAEATGTKADLSRYRGVEGILLIESVTEADKSQSGA